VTHPALPAEALDRLTARFGHADPPGAPTSGTAPPDGADGPRSRLSRVLRRASGPVLDRVAARAVGALRADGHAGSAEVVRLRAEVAELRAALEAEIALVRAELDAARRPPP
jgi:hypothetical protein